MFESDYQSVEERETDNISKVIVKDFEERPMQEQNQQKEKENKIQSPNEKEKKEFKYYPEYWKSQMNKQDNDSGLGGVVSTSK